MAENPKPKALSTLLVSMVIRTDLITVPTIIRTINGILNIIYVSRLRIWGCR